MPIAPQGRAIAEQFLGGLPGVRYASPDGAFYAFLQVEGISDSLTLAQTLVTRHGIAVAPGIAFGAGAGKGGCAFATPWPRNA